MKLGFSTLGCPEWDISRIATEAQKAQFDGVELRGVYGEHVDPTASPKKRQAIRTRFADHGVELLGVTAYTTFTAIEPTERKRNIEELIRYVDLAEDLGAGFVRTFGGDVPNDVDADEVAPSVADALIEVINATSGSRARIAFETHDSWSSVRHVLPLLNTTGCEELRILWDVPHSLRAGDIPEDAAKNLGERIAYLHMKDEVIDPKNEEQPVLPGDGSVPVCTILSAIESIGFDGFICFEWERKWHPSISPLDVALPAFRKWIADCQQS